MNITLKKYTTWKHYNNMRVRDITILPHLRINTVYSQANYIQNSIEFEIGWLCWELSIGIRQ